MCPIGRGKVCCAHMLKLQFRHIDTVVQAMRVGNKYDIGVYTMRAYWNILVILMYLTRWYRGRATSQLLRSRALQATRCKISNWPFLRLFLIFLGCAYNRGKKYCPDCLERKTMFTCSTLHT
jgi:hypothetical protein